MEETPEYLRERGHHTGTPTSEVITGATTNPPNTLRDSVTPVGVEINSSEIRTFIPEINGSSGIEFLDATKWEGGETADVRLPKTQSITGSEQSSSEYVEKGSRESQDVKPLWTNPTLLTGSTSETKADTPLSSDAKNTFIPPVAITLSWEVETSSSTPQESQADQEHSTPVTEEAGNVLLGVGVETRDNSVYCE